MALQPLGCPAAAGEEEEEHTAECGLLLPKGFSSSSPVSGAQLHALYLSLLIGCLSGLLGTSRADAGGKPSLPTRSGTFLDRSTRNAGNAEATPPLPAKKPRLGGLCPYRDATFDLLLELDDGTRLPANREAVSGRSEYFRALLGGGFEEAAGGAGRAIPIRDVSGGMLLTVLHHLHGCRLPASAQEEEGDGEALAGRCQVLGALAREGLGLFPGTTETLDFQVSPLGEAMVGACRFLVTELRREAEELCVEALLAHATATPPPRDPGRPLGESTDEGLARRASALELSGGAESRRAEQEEEQGVKEQVEGRSDGPVCGSSSSQTDRTLRTARGPAKTSGDPDLPPQEPKTPLPRSVSSSKPRGPDKTRPRPKHPRRSLRPVPPDPSPLPWSTGGAEGQALWGLLPQVYRFSQRYSYPALGRACLTLLLGGARGPRAQPRPTGSSSSGPGDCLGRLALEADCPGTLKQDLLDLVTLALS